MTKMTMSMGIHGPEIGISVRGLGLFEMTVNSGTYNIMQ